MKKLVKNILLSSLLISASNVYAGAITTFNDRNTFDIAVGATVIEDFTPTHHFPLNSGVLNSLTNEAGLNPGDIQSGVTYSTTVGTGNFFNIDAGGGFTGGMLDSIGGNHDLTVSFDNLTSSFGFDTNRLMGTSFDIDISFASGGSTSLQFNVAQSDSMEFFGFQSSLADIDSLLIRGNHNTFNFIVDNFAFGGKANNPNPVPEPSIIALMGLGIFGLGLSRRKMKK